MCTTLLKSAILMLILQLRQHKYSKSQLVICIFVFTCSSLLVQYSVVISFTLCTIYTSRPLIPFGKNFVLITTDLVLKYCGQTCIKYFSHLVV